MAFRTMAHKSISGRIFVLILAVVVSLAGFDFYNSAQEKKRRIAEVTQDFTAAARDGVAKIDDLINTSEELLSGLSETNAVLGSNLFSCTRVLQSVGAKFTKYTNFSVVNADKFIVCSSGPLKAPKDVSTSPNILEAFRTKSFAVSPFKFGVLTGEPVLVLSQPLFDPNGQVSGTLNNGLSMKWLRAYLADLSRLDGQRMVVINGQGEVMSSHPQNLFKIGSSIADTELGRQLNGKTDGALIFKDETGHDVLAGFASVSRIPGGAVVAAFAPLPPLLADMQEKLYIHLALLLSLAGGALFVSWTGVRALVLDPINKLILLAGKVEDGDFTARSNMAYHSGELGTLALAYDRMLDVLNDRTEKLRESEAHYRELVESEEHLVHRFLPDTTEVFVNKPMAAFFGGTPQDWVGQKWVEHVSDDERSVIMARLENCTPDAPAFVYEQMSNNSDGEPRWLRWNNRAFFDDDGRVTHFQAVAIDLTDRKNAERNLESAVMEALAANRAKSNFLANMSHELRTPLNSIIGFSEMMTSGVMGVLPPKLQEYSSFITTSGHNLLNIVNDILDLSKIEAGMLQLEEGDVHLNREVKEVLSMLHTQALKNDNTLNNRLGEGLPFILRGDRMRLKQVLLNILSNALKFTQDGDVNIEGAYVEGAIVLKIIDTGIGMSLHDINVALSPFGQVDGHHLSKRYEGTGLGLPLAVQLMEMHGGHLSIESTPGQGTCVILKFPPERTVSVN